MAATVAVTPKSVEESPDFGCTLVPPTAEGAQTPYSDANAKLEQATMAARYAQEAASNSATLAHHVAQLSSLVHNLHYQLGVQTSKVHELEEWKNKTLVDMRKLRDEHKQLRKKYGVDQEDPKISRSLSNPVSILSDETPSATSLPSDEALSRSSLHLKTMPAAVDIVPPAPGAPPGLEMPQPLSRVITGATEATIDEDEDAAPGDGTPVDGSPGGAQGITVKDKLVDGKAVKKAEWKIGRLSAQLRGCCGRALVSPPFAVWGLEDLRLMIYADKKESGKGPRSRRQKELYNKKVSEGPLESCLKLKVPNCTTSNELSFLFTVGEDEIRSAEYTHNFMDATVSEPVEFGELDWLEKADKEGGLMVSVEIKEVSAS